MTRARTIFQKGLILISVPLLFQLAFIGILFRIQGQNAEAQKEANHAQKVLTQAHAVLGSVVDAQAGMRGYVITGDTVFAEPYEEAIREVPRQLAELRALVQDNSQQSDRAERIAAKVDESLRWIGEGIRLLRAGQREDTIARVAQEGKRRMDELRAEMNTLLGEEVRLHEERSQRLERSQKVLFWSLLVGGLAALVTTIMLVVIFNREISGRLAILTENVRRFARGEELTSATVGNDEVAELDRSFRDMTTELACSRESLHEQMAILQSVLDSMGDAVVVADQSEQLLIFNPAAERLFGKGITDSPPEQWPQEYGVYLPDGQTLLSQDQLPLLRAVRGESVNDVELLVRPAASKRSSWVTVIGRPLTDADGKLRGGVAVFRDITERKLAEEALRHLNEELEKRVRERTTELTTAIAQLQEEVAERKRAEAARRRSEDDFRLMVESVEGYAILTLDPDGYVTSWNEGAQRSLGYTAEEIIGQHSSRFYTSEDIARGWPGKELEVARAAGRFEDEGWRVRKDGGRFWANVIVTAVHDEQGQLIGCSQITRDLTERKWAEDRLRTLNAELEAQLAKLAETNRELAAKSQENEMFVYSVSHDLRSPLVNLQGFSKELEKGCHQIAALLEEADAPPAVQDGVRTVLEGKMAMSLGFVQSSVLRLSNIIDALLRLSRAGRVEYRWEMVDVATVVTRVVEATHGTATEKQAQIEIGELPPVYGDASALEQLFANLIGNALVYLDPARRGQIQVGCLAEEADGMRTYYVRDNGLGMAENHQRKIFQMFQRAHPGVGKGEGIGLSIVSRVAERHGGRVWVESRAGEGSTFFVSLPTHTKKEKT